MSHDTPSAWWCEVSYRTLCFRPRTYVWACSRTRSSRFGAPSDKRAIRSESEARLHSPERDLRNRMLLTIVIFDPGQDMGATGLVCRLLSQTFRNDILKSRPMNRALGLEFAPTYLNNEQTLGDSTNLLRSVKFSKVIEDSTTLKTPRTWYGVRLNMVQLRRPTPATN